MEDVKKITKIGACKYCGQMRSVEALESWTQEDIDEAASFECVCDEAKTQRKKIQRMEAAKDWIGITLGGEKYPVQVMQSAIDAVFNGDADYISMKIGRYIYRVGADSDGMIRIKKTYKESDEKSF